ncbi:MAG: hypothetical protein RIS34_599 [Pseudomonadota bacterium]|jgi:uncharacterized protein
MHLHRLNMIKSHLRAQRAVLGRWLLAVGVASLGGLSQAQIVAPNVAVPFYTPGSFMQGAYQHWYAPQAADFSRQAATLPEAVMAVCDASMGTRAVKLRQARALWQATAIAWDRLNGVPIGPIVQRRSARQIDFTPTRPELIERAIQTAPADPAAMERIGSPAKGLPALEWLLWSRPVAPNTPACRYAMQVAADVDREAAALSQAFSDLAALDLGEEEATSVPAMSELVNQWVGGLERLHWADMEKPALSIASGVSQGKGVRNAGYPRNVSAQTAASWAAHWQALRTLAVSAASEAPRPGTALVPLETYLRGRGLNPVAGTLVQRVGNADQAMKNLSPAHSAGLTSAVRQLTALKKLVEAEVAPALDVNIGFTDADGD